MVVRSNISVKILSLGTYRGYLNKSSFIETLKIRKKDALDNCMLNAMSNPTSTILFFVRPPGIEPGTFSLKGSCSTG